jgi:hypothetical protein
VNGTAQSADSALTTASVDMKWVNGWSAAATFGLRSIPDASVTLPVMRRKPALESIVPQDRMRAERA